MDHCDFSTGPGRYSGRILVVETLDSGTPRVIRLPTMTFVLLLFTRLKNFRVFGRPLPLSRHVGLDPLRLLKGTIQT